MKTTTTRDNAWKDNGHGDSLQYDFLPPPHWPPERIAQEREAFTVNLQAQGDAEHADLPGWLRLARRLPEGLRAALLLELSNGNQICGIGLGWPAENSVVVTVGERFSAAKRAPPEGVVWRGLNDPHSWREEMSQKIDGTEFLLIT